MSRTNAANGSSILDNKHESVGIPRRLLTGITSLQVSERRDATDCLWSSHRYERAVDDGINRVADVAS